MIHFDCDRFVAALDASPDPALRARAEAHAASCAACAERLAAESAVAALFSPASGSAVPAPSASSTAFTDRVMALVARTPQEGVPSALPAAAVTPVRPWTADAVPWWIRAVAHPACALALVLAGIGIVLAPQLLGASRSAPQWSADLLPAFARATAPRLDPVTATTFLPLVALFAVVLYRFGATLATAPFVASFARDRRGRA